jgi:hypothetical protein
LEALVVLYSTKTFDILSEIKGIDKEWSFTPNSDIQLMFSFYNSLSTEHKKIALEFCQFLAEKQMMEKRVGGNG